VLAQSLQVISLEGVVLLVVNLLIGGLVAFMAWALKRQVQQNDQKQAEQDAKIAKACDQVRTETEARHESFHKLDDRVWAVNADLKENYARRTEVMRQYGTLTQRLSESQREILEEIRRLPCMKPVCPADAERAQTSPKSGPVPGGTKE